MMLSSRDVYFLPKSLKTLKKRNKLFIFNGGSPFKCYQITGLAQSATLRIAAILNFLESHSLVGKDFYVGHSIHLTCKRGGFAGFKTPPEWCLPGGVQ